MEQQVPVVGRTVPDFRSRDQHGRDFDLQAWRGGPVLLFFFAFSFSSVCRDELENLRDMAYLFDAARCRLVAVSTDTTFVLREVDRQFGLDFTLVSDHWPHGAIGRAYGAFDDKIGCDRRHSYLIGPDGVLAWSKQVDLPTARDVGEHLAAVHYHFPL
ncbi:redoxin domain-containing protein [Raineyella sp. W15-4]|uniref:redoxin domain-containing protein n=1 Tax=Raineyella sp. W15-4 TaxID=3081651 RepID=UPI002952E1FD|nr:redoxin domain-containing protein [Raineyella sp. W15-4]WOQ15608.1 redoxin domain-containing protein [Raineyella sp. W15-4]